MWSVPYFSPPLEYWDMVKHFDHVSLMVFNKSGHLPQYEQQKAFDQKLLTWMGIQGE
jgi:pimeloyl-ACP methyl ester carboxylesterase